MMCILCVLGSSTSLINETILLWMKTENFQAGSTEKGIQFKGPRWLHLSRDN